MILIRRPMAADYEAWLAMRLALWPGGTREEHLAEMQDFGGLYPNLATFLAVDEGGIPCGFAEACLRSHAEDCRTHPVGYLEGIFVLPECRARGIGRALVNAAQQWAAGQGCSEMASDCLHDNEESIRFHRSLGFEEVDTLVHFRRPILPL